MKKKPYLKSLIMKQSTLAHEPFCDITISLTDSNLTYSIFQAQPIFVSVSNQDASIVFYTLGLVRALDLTALSTGRSLTIKILDCYLSLGIILLNGRPPVDLSEALPGDTCFLVPLK